MCHRRDGAAVASFLRWLRDELSPPPTSAGASGGAVRSISEVDIDLKLTQCREQYSPNMFIGRSFDTIAGVNGNGAIIHYRLN